MMILLKKEENPPPLSLSSWLLILLIGTISCTTTSTSQIASTPTVEMVPSWNNSPGLAEETGPILKQLKIAVPNKTDFQEFVKVLSFKDSQNIDGYSIEVFRNAVKELPYNINFTFVPYKDGVSNPSYDEMVTSVSNGEYDALVGDVTIRSYRIQEAYFTQPYLESGLVVVAPVKIDNFSEKWAFLRPFTLKMWLAIVLCIVLTGLIVWILEHRENSHFRGPPNLQATTIFWFIFSTMFFAQREEIKSALGRVVVIVWLFVVMITVSSYTANLTSILTVESLSPTINGIKTLENSLDRIGYQKGSFVKDFLIEELHIEEKRLVGFNKVEEYANALELGPNDPNGVAAIVDEMPYAQVLLSQKCGFAITGQEFTRSGFGYAFPKDSELGRDLSVAILRLSENGRLQEIHDKWLTMVECNSQIHSDRLRLTSFEGLFIITGATSGGCLLIYFTVFIIRFWTSDRTLNTSSQMAENDGSSNAHNGMLQYFQLYFNNRSHQNSSPEPSNHNPSELGNTNYRNDDNC